MKNFKTIAGILTLSIAGYASADATIYGQLHASLDYIDTTNHTTIENRFSRIGFRGSETLSTDLSVIWQVESSVDVTGKTNTQLGTRNTYVGVSHVRYGTFLVGQHDTPYKLALGSVGSNPLIETMIDTWSLAGIQHERAKSTVFYRSPVVSGVVASAAVVSTDDTSNNLYDVYSVAATFNRGGLTLTAGYEDLTKDSSHNRANVKKMIGVGYTVSDVTLTANYVEQDSVNLYAITGTYNLGNIRFFANYVNDDVSNGHGVAAAYQFTTRTNAYVAYVDTKAGNEVKGTSLGLIHRF